LVYIPNSFTPDLAEHKRLFGVEYDCTFSEFQLRIFDRWGEMIWESKDPEAQWDGTYQNRMAPDGVYIYQLKYSSTGVFDEVVNGHVSLLR
jgi:gliding motility-associated-like protein